MNIGMIGGGGVAQTLAAKLIANGHDVAIGIRVVNDTELGKDRRGGEPLRDWQARTGGRVTTLHEAARHGEIIVNATPGDGSLEALTAAGAANLAGKVLIDMANALDFSQGMPPFLDERYTGTTSLGEAIQAAFPDTRVVKAFNTVATVVLVDPGQIAGDHDLFIAGNDEGAKAIVTAMAKTDLGWTHVVDLGDIVGARGTEALLPIWVHLMGLTGGVKHNFHLARG